MKDQELSHRFSLLENALVECRVSLKLLTDLTQSIKDRLENPQSSTRESDLDKQVKLLKERNKDE